VKVYIDSYAWISKTDVSSVQLDALRKALTIVPRKVGDHPGEPPGPIRLFSENAARFGMPRQFFLGRRKPAHEVEFHTTEGDKTSWPGDLKFAGSLREEQVRGVHTVVSLFRAGSLGGIYQAVPGHGKTVCACAIMAQLQVPTLVVVHKEFLMDQWRQRILQFLPEAQIGLVQGPTCDFKGKHIVLGMIHSLCDKEYSEEFKHHFGLICFDETHRVGAGTWSAVPPLFPAKWRLGISATPRRKDGAEAVFHHHIGEVIFAAKEVRMKPKIRKVWITPDLFKLVHTPNFNPSLIKKGLLLRFMCASAGRNRVITEQLIQAVKAGRRCLVLSERLQHLNELETLLYKTWADADGAKPSVGFYIGGQEQTALDEAAKCQVIFATSQLVQEGLDIPPLDTLFMTTPLSDIEQAVGRILRPFEGKKEPVVVDFRDDHIGICKRYGEFRDKQYSRIA
jgi:superfamily II DNA or RNA helicase